jgi:hypothetical protein
MLGEDIGVEKELFTIAGVDQTAEQSAKTIVQIVSRECWP